MYHFISHTNQTARAIDVSLHWQGGLTERCDHGLGAKVCDLAIVRSKQLAHAAEIVARLAVCT